MESKNFIVGSFVISEQKVFKNGVLVDTCQSARSFILSIKEELQLQAYAEQLNKALGRTEY